MMRSPRPEARVSNEHDPGFPNSRGRAALLLLVGSLLAMMVIAAGVVVVHNARRIEPVEVPVHLRPQAPDLGLRRFRRGTRQRLGRIVDRYERYHRQVEAPNPVQESLSAVIEVELAGLRVELAVLDTLAESGDQRELEGLRGPVSERYRALVNTVSSYVRTVLAREGPELDSLDREIERLLLDE